MGRIIFFTLTNKGFFRQNESCVLKNIFYYI